MTASQPKTYDFSHWGDQLPKASCICITYGRPHLIGEAIESFLRQDYAGKKELIILNDHPDILLELEEHPEIILVNHPERYPSIGAKRNAASAMSSGDVIFPWDDDDINLPWRISTTLEKMKNLSYYKPTNLWWWDGVDVEHKQGVMAHAMGAYSRELFNKLDGYPDFNSGEDQEFEAKIAALGLHDTSELPLDEVFYIYRMIGTNTYHLSYHGYGKGLEECENHVSKTTPAGLSSIQPQWKDDYTHLAVKKSSEIKRSKQTSTQGLSICFSLKNRSSVPHGNTHLKLFPNCIQSIAALASHSDTGDIEIVVADFHSTDWPLTEWIRTMAGDTPITIVPAEGNFSRGRGLNMAANAATHDNLLICDADVILEAEAIIEGLQQLASGKAWFPIIQHLDEQGNPSCWGYDGLGISFVTKRMFKNAGGIPEFESWGGEDNIFHQSIACQHSVSRHECSAIKHQWHPETCKHEHYSKPMREDYQTYTSSPDVQHNYHPENIGNNHGTFRVFQGEHPQWSGFLHLHENGHLTRPGVDTGTYEMEEEKSIVLRWNRWDPEKLEWDNRRNCYCDHTRGFTLREISPFDQSTETATNRLNPEKLIIGVLATLHPDYQYRRERCANTWLPVLEAAGVEILFLVGTGKTTGSPEIVSPQQHGRIGTELQIPCPDDYDSLPQKTAAWCRWAIKHRDFDHLFKCDDDTYIVPRRLLNIDLSHTPYIGHKWRHTLNDGHGHASGGAGYFLDRNAAKVIAATMTEKKGPEDLIVAQHLLDANIELTDDCRFAIIDPDSDYPSPDNQFITGHADDYPWIHHDAIWHQNWECYFPPTPNGHKKNHDSSNVLHLDALDFWHPNSRKEKENNGLVELLRKKSTVCINEHQPDVALCSCFGNLCDSLPPEVLRVQYLGENHRPDTSRYHCSISFDRNEDNNHMRLPLYVLYREWFEQMLALNTPENKAHLLHETREFCGAMVSNPHCENRNAFMQMLMDRDLLASGGGWMNNISKTIPEEESITFRSKYRFFLAFENASHPGYVTEKILGAMAAGCIPVYWGAPDVGMDFNEASFINCHHYDSFEEVIQKMVDIHNSTSDMETMLSQPWMLTEHLARWHPDVLSEKAIDFIRSNLDQLRNQ